MFPSRSWGTRNFCYFRVLINELTDRLRMRRFTFNALGDPTWLATLVLFAVAAAVCIVLLYRYERRLVHRRLGLTLLSLRLAVVGIVFVTLLEPVLTWTIDRTQTGRVLIAVDVSDSMATIDKQAGQAERLRWIRALKMIGNDAVDAQLDRWQEAFENDREPEWVRPDETSDPVERAEREAARRQQLDELMDAVGNMSRKEIARRLIDSGPAALWDRINDLAIGELQVFAGEAAVADAENLPELVAHPGRSLQTGVSDLLVGVTPAGSAAETPLAGVVLFTDGRENAALDGEQLLARLRGLPVPVYPVLMGSQRRPRDLAVGELEYPEMVYQDDTALLHAQLRTPGFDGQELTVTLEPADHPEQSQSQTITATDRTLDVEFQLDATELGRHAYVLRIAGQPGETRDDNNEKSFTVNVVDDETRVLVLDGAARWEFRFLDNALTRDERVHVDPVLFRQPYLGVLPETFFPRTLVLPEDAAQANESPFAEYDAIIIGDVAPSELPEPTWLLLDRFVREGGGTLVLTAGKDHFPTAYNSPTVERLLPVERLHVIEASGPQQTGPPSMRGFHLTLTPDGARQEFLQFDADAQANARIWDALPGHPWGLVGEAKPAATVFASLRDERGQGGLDFERNNALIAHQHAGAGQVLWIGVDSTWRWRLRVGDRYHHRFWGQITRWAAKFKASAGNEHVRFGLDRSEIEVGEEALLRARWNRRFLNEFPDLKARAEFFAVDAPEGAAPVLAIDLEPTDAKPLIYEGKSTSLEAGEYRVELKVADADLGDEPVTAELIVAERGTSELAELAADRGLLEQIAEVTGGRMFYPDQVDEIPELFASVTQHESAREEVPLWDHWLVLVLCFGLLTTEWVLRKLNGLP